MDRVLQYFNATHNGTGYPYTKISSLAGQDVAEFIFENVGYTGLIDSPYFTDTRDTLPSEMSNAGSVIDLKHFNGLVDLNKYFGTVNKILCQGGLYIGCFESHDNRKKRISSKYHKPFSYLVLMIASLKRNLIPPGRTGRSRNRKFRRNKGRSLSLAEGLGRLVYCGFEIIDYKSINNYTYFICKKKNSPNKDKCLSSGFIAKMERIGKGGKIIMIYKIRTMYPYSEYLQDFIVQNNGYNSIGKPNNDFRLLKQGKFLRKYYIDEIPQFINLLKGDINIVGVRPLSRAGLKYLPPDVLKERTKFKPGLIPPQVSLRATGIEGVIRAERKYLDDMKKGPLKTNIRYFFRALFNIITFRVKSN